jgi:hypothetical protein
MDQTQNFANIAARPHDSERASEELTVAVTAGPDEGLALTEPVNSEVGLSIQQLAFAKTLGRILAAHWAAEASG